MMFSKSVNSLAIAAIIATASLTPLSGAASARDWDRQAGDRGGPAFHDHDIDGRRGRGEWRQDRFEGYRHRDHSGRNIAIGAFAAILGLAIAAEASRDYHGDRY